MFREDGCSHGSVRSTTLIALLAAAACESPHQMATALGPCPAPEGAAPPPPAFVAFRATFAPAICSWRARCVAYTLPEPVASCATGEGEQEATRLFGPCAEEALRAGRVDFDPAMADACIAALANSVCDSAALVLCSRVLRGRVEPGAYCGDEQSVSWSWPVVEYIRRSECATGTCEGTGCASSCHVNGIGLGRLGDPCPAPGCEPPLRCSGGLCSLPSEGEPCGSTCRPGLACIRPSVSEGTCENPRAASEPCVTSRECGVGLVCRSQKCTEYRGEGELCAGAPDGAGECGPGLFCTAMCLVHQMSECGTGQCARRPTEVGEACSLSCGLLGTRWVGCIDGSRCFGRDLACSGIGSIWAPVGAGACFSSAEAVDRMDCRYNDCPLGYVCERGRCQQYHPPHSCP